MNKVEIFTSQTCTYCHKAKKLLALLGLEYTEHDVSDSFDEMCNKLSAQYDKPVSSIPQIIINDTFIGGYDDLEAKYKSGELKKNLL